MKRLTYIFLFIIYINAFSQDVDKYFEKIRNNSAELTAFFSQMPKGGDLHHHYSGAIYAETYIKYVIDNDFWINKNTLEVSKTKLSNDNWSKFSSLKNEGTLADYQEKLLQKWSVKDYNFVSYPSDKHFFETFPNFNIASQANIDKGLLEIKNRAILENVSYIETMLTSIPCDKSISELLNYNDSLRKYNLLKDTANAFRILDYLYKQIIQKNVEENALNYNQSLNDIHSKLAIDDTLFTMRYLNYVVRVVPPIEVFKSLIIAFISADRSPLIVGVNIVAPEDNETSMSDYWVQMAMFNYCHSKYPNVKYSLHAGELTLGLVKPEDLSWHINSAVHFAGANRIGHGVDLPYENNCYELLNFMRNNEIAIEINLFSNEFILKVKNDKHPITLYKDFDVPIVICTDDAGVLRTNLTEQFVLLSQRYNTIKYKDIKQFVYNSIKYSFIEDKAIKAKLMKDLDFRFNIFEKEIRSIK